jgi:YVTN family beta-propeller protein
MSPIGNIRNKTQPTSFALATSLVAAAFAAPASARSTPPVPTFVDHIVLGWGGPGASVFSGQIGENEVLSSLAVDPNTGNIWAKDFEGHITVISRITITNKAEADIDINPDLAAVFASKPLAMPEAAVTVNTIYQNAPDPRAIAIDPKTGNVYVPCDPNYTYTKPFPNEVLVFNTLTNSLIATILAPGTSANGSNPYDVVIDSDTGTVYVANASSGALGNVMVIDEKTNTVTGYIHVGTSVGKLAIDPKSRKVFTANYGGQSVSVIDINKHSATYNTVIATIPLGVGPNDIAVDPRTGKVFTANLSASSVSVIDEKTNAVSATIPTPGYGPYVFAVDSAHGIVHVQYYSTGPMVKPAAAVIDEATNSITGTFLTFANARGFAIDATRGFLYSGDGMPNSVAGVTVYHQTRF